MPLTAIGAAVEFDTEPAWRRLLFKRMPILTWLPAYDLRRDLKFDFIAGITVAVMLVPQEMSLAALMGVPAEYGLYSAAIAPLAYPLFGSSRALSVANAAEGSLLIGVMLRSVQFESPDERVPTAILITFFAGFFMVLGALLHQGGVITFFSRTAMNAYVTATGVLIVVSQLPALLGVGVDTTELTIFTVLEVLGEATETNLNALSLGLASMIILVICKQGRAWLQSSKTIKKVNSRVHAYSDHKHPLSLPSALMTKSADTIAADVDASIGVASSSDHDPLDDDTNHLLHRTPDASTLSSGGAKPTSTLKATACLLCDASGLLVCIVGIAVGSWLGDDALQLTGEVHKGFPEVVFPPAMLGSLVPWHRLEFILCSAVVVAMILFTASVAAGSKLAHQGGYEISPNQELLGVGFANLCSSFFQGMPSSGGLSRSAVNSQNAHTPLASMITAVLVMLTMCFLTGPLAYLPKSPLAAIVMVAAFSIVTFAEPRWLRRVRRDEYFVWIAAFASTLLTGLLRGLVLSIVASLVAIMARTRRPMVVELGECPDGSFAPLTDPGTNALLLPDAVVLRTEQSLYFANATHFIHAVERALRHAQKLVGDELRGAVVDGARINDIDATALHVLLEYADKLRARELCLVFANLRPETLDNMKRVGLVDAVRGDAKSANPLSIGEALEVLRQTD